MGLVLLDWPDLDRLTAACARYRRHEFLLTVAPLPIAGGTGSPVNPIATFYRTATRPPEWAVGSALRLLDDRHVAALCLLDRRQNGVL